MHLIDRNGKSKLQKKLLTPASQDNGNKMDVVIGGGTEDNMYQPVGATQYSMSGCYRIYNFVTKIEVANQKLTIFGSKLI